MPAQESRRQPTQRSGEPSVTRAPGVSVGTAAEMMDRIEGSGLTLARPGGRWDGTLRQAIITFSTALIREVGGPDVVTGQMFSDAFNRARSGMHEQLGPQVTFLAGRNFGRFADTILGDQEVAAQARDAQIEYLLRARGN
jgi:hypothetical protein